MNFIEELQWRGMIHDKTPGVEELCKQGGVTGYAGFDPTSSSLHIGNLIPIMLLVHFQRSGNRPIALIGGATGMIGDPSGKSEERQLLSMEVIRFNQERLKAQLERFLDFSGSNFAEIVNNYDWFREMGFLEFLRDVGKLLTVNYMVAKDSVKGRWENGISFTEFSYQLLQAYDFLWLYKNKNCRLQIGGSDQWGNILSGTELIRRTSGGEAHAITCPLLTRSDGKKFGKSEEGESIWLDRTRTSPYKFYQYWLNITDADAPRLLQMFTLFSRQEIEGLIDEQRSAPHERPMQKALARDITVRVHSEQDYLSAVEASEVLFGKGTTDTLRHLSEEDFLSVFEGVPQADIPRATIEAGVPVIDFVAGEIAFFTSKGEARRMIQQGGLSVNKEKISDQNAIIGSEQVLNGKYVLLQKGRKSYCLVRVV
jgi:tyrosyl-tRNA synthetase